VKLSSPAALRIAIVVGAVVMLEVICRLGLVKPINLIPPSAMVARLLDLVREAKFWSEVGATVHNIASPHSPHGPSGSAPASSCTACPGCGVSSSR
jgi:hypothetical protein